MTKKEIRRENKKNGKKVLKSHYVLLFAVCLIAAVLGADYSGSLSLFNSKNIFTQAAEVVSSAEGNVITTFGYDGLVESIFSDTYEQYKEKAEQEEKQDATKSTSIGALKLERQKGILAAVVNKVESSTILLTLVSACVKITGSKSFGSTLFIMLSALLIIAFYLFIVNIYKTILCRIFIESRIYGKIPKVRFLFPLKSKKWLKMTGAMFKKTMYLIFWSCTIVGGFIKYYSYYMVPFIIAENPDVTGSEALTLSRQMMNGHKWEFFVADLSFLPWLILNIFTVGLLKLFFLNQYMTATFTEYFVEFRKDQIDGKKAGYELFNDKYLYEKASVEEIDKVYADIIELKKEPKKEPFKTNKVARFFANIFGIVLFYGEKEKQYRTEQKKEYRIKAYEQAIEGNIYPARLSPTPEKEKLSDLESLDYNRCYSIISLILIFFAMCFIGWLWEGCIHVVQDGIFINRGVMHGPWLPIYGSGCTLVLILLKKFRNKPWLEFIMAVVLCGIAEYMTSVILQMHFDGQKWWDYTGYFLNINGRVCAEGLLVFGLGGTMFVYFIAPLIDNIIRKINIKILIVACIILIIGFTIDNRISAKYPNTGKGITDYGTSAFYVPEEDMSEQVCSLGYVAGDVARPVY